MMNLVESYIFRMALTAFLAALGVLTGIIWLSLSLREFDLLTSKGQSLWVFFSVTGLTIPSLIVVIAPIALFIAVLYSLNRLNSDSELIVMSAAGLSPKKLVRPFVVLTVMTALIVSSMSLYAMPASFHALRDLVSKIRSDFLTRVVREGQFTSLDQGFVFHYRERGARGEMLGIFMQDRREPGKVNTYIAEVGVTREVEGHNYLILEKGSLQRMAQAGDDPAIVTFESYAIDLAQFGSDGSGFPLRPRERSTKDMLWPNPDDAYRNANLGRFRAELHDRFINPLYALVFGMIGFAALGEARTTRQGRGMAIAAALGAVLLLRVFGFWASALLNRNAAAIPLAYAIPCLGFAAASFYAFGPSWSDLTRWLPRSRAASVPSTVA